MPQKLFWHLTNFYVNFNFIKKSKKKTLTSKKFTSEDFVFLLKIKKKKFDMKTINIKKYILKVSTIKFFFKYHLRKVLNN